MLEIIFGKNENNTVMYFKNTYNKKWILDDFSKSVIKDVDKSIVINESNIENKVLGIIHPLQLSGGVKTLLLMKFDKKYIYNASNCGDNCAKWIIELAKNKKLTINLRHIMHFDFKKENIKMRILNSGKIIDSEKDYIDEAIKYI